MKHVVNFSGGLCSWMAARRVADEHGTDNMVLLFADTLIEDHDTYRFIKDASADIGVPITRISKEKTPWDVFFEHHCMGNSKIDMCSQELKRELLDDWRRRNCDPWNTTIYVGLHWNEAHRWPRFEKAMWPWRVKGPMMEAPLMDTEALMAAALARGIKPSRAYYEGFPHDNCGGFCVKAGQGQFKLLLEKRPEVFAFHEAKEQEFRARFQKDVSIMKDRTGGTTKPLTLRVLRERIEAKQAVDIYEWGGCGCAIE